MTISKEQKPPDFHRSMIRSLSSDRTTIIGWMRKARKIGLDALLTLQISFQTVGLALNLILNEGSPDRFERWRDVCVSI